MQQRALTISGLLVAFIVIGGAWNGVVRLLPSGLPRSIFVVAVCLTFVSIFVALLLQRIRSLLGGRNGIWSDLALVMAEVGLLIGSFAAVYMSLGILDNTQGEATVVHDFWLSAYYSVVTFTTLGYGDFYPVGIGRALAAIEACVGYVVLGLIASSAASVISPHQPAGTRPGGEGADDGERKEGGGDDEAGGEGRG